MGHRHHPDHHHCASRLERYTSRPMIMVSYTLLALLSFHMATVDTFATTRQPS